MYKHLLLFILFINIAIVNTAEVWYKVKSDSTKGKSPVEISFLKDTLRQKSGEFSFNSVIMQNHSSSPITFTLRLKVPTFFRMLRQADEKYTLAPGEKKSFPLRIQGESMAEGHVSHTIYAEATDASGNSMTSASYQIILEPISEWKALLPKRESFFNMSDKEAILEVFLTNMGNMREEISFEYVTSEAFTVKEAPPKVILAPGTDSVLRLVFSFQEKNYAAKKSENLMIRMQSTSGKKTILFTNLTPMATSVRQHQTRWYRMNTLIDVGAQSIGRTNPFYYVNITGNIPMEKNRSLSYFYRSNFVSNLGGAVTGTLLNIQYRSKRFSISAGDQTQLYERIIFGLGGSMSYKIGNSEIEIVGAKNRLRPIQTFGGRYTYNFSKDNKLSIQALQEKDDSTGTLANIYHARYEQAFNKETSLLFGVGYGREHLTNREQGLSEEGYRFMGQFNKEGKRYNLRLNGDYSSDFYPGITRGATSILVSASIRIGNWFLGPIYRKAKNSSRFLGDIRQINFPFNTNVYELEMKHRGKGYNIEIGSGYSYENQSDASIESYGLRVNAGASFARNGYLRFYGYTSASRLLGGEKKYFLRYNTTMDIRYEFFGMNARYRRGPFFIGEVSRFGEEQSVWDEMQISPYLEKTFLNTRLNVRARYDFIRNYGNSNTFSTVGGDVRYNITKDLSASVSASYNTSFRNNRFFMNTGLRKQLHVPLVGLTRYHKLKVVLFKDTNANGKFDEGEEAISQAALKIRDNFFVTDKQGSAIYNNIEKGEYLLDLTSVMPGKGWRPINGYTKNLIVSHSMTHYVPYVQGKFIQGKIELERAKYSEMMISLANIRITITDKEGRSFLAFTDEEGKFSVDLPDGIYEVVLNEKVFSDKFKIMIGKAVVDLVNTDSGNITFEVKEVSRQINIKK